MRSGREGEHLLSRRTRLLLLWVAWSVVGGGGFDLAVDGDSGRSWTVDLKVFSLFMIDSADILWYSGGDLQGTVPCSYFARDEEDLTRDGPNRVSASLARKATRKDPASVHPRSIPAITTSLNYSYNYSLESYITSRITQYAPHITHHTSRLHIHTTLNEYEFRL